MCNLGPITSISTPLIVQKMWSTLGSRSLRASPSTVTLSTVRLSVGTVLTLPRPLKRVHIDATVLPTVDILMELREQPTSTEGTQAALAAVTSRWGSSVLAFSIGVDAFSRLAIAMLPCG